MALRTFRSGFSVLVLLFFLINNKYTSAQELFYPVDIAYHEAHSTFYVSNWADGAGNVLTLDTLGNIESFFVQGLTYAGGLCIVGDILYVVNNTGLYNSGEPCYLEGININTGVQVLHKLIAADGAYLDKVIRGRDGMLYISDSGLGKIYDYTISTGDLGVIANPGNDFFLYSICYDLYDDRIIFTYSSFTASYLKSVSPDGGPVTNLAYYNGFLENVIMEADGDFYVSSWGNDYVWGNEYIFRYNHTFNQSITATTGLNRPFGMYKNELKNELVVCNWGGHTISFIDLTPIGTKEMNPRKGFRIISSDDSPVLKVEFFQDTKVYSLTISDLSGKTIHNITGPTVRDGALECDVHSLTAGVYILRVHSEEGTIAGKFFIR